MKKRSLFLLVFLFSLLPIQAQEALYIYRNDNHFNAFFYEEIDSIVYSHLDIDSLVHDDYVTQEIYTNDSIFRIPLSVIDSIGFVNPEVIYKPNVKRVEELMSNYLRGADELKLTFDAKIPTKDKFQKGDILLCLDFDNPFFEEGYVGKVTNTYVEGNSYIVDCTPIDDLSDIFLQFIAVEEVTPTSPNAVKARRSEGHSDMDLFSKDMSLKYDLIKTDNFTVALDGHLSANLRLKTTYKFTDENQFIEMSLINSIGGGLGIKVEGETPFKTFKHSLLKPPPARFPAACPVMKCQFTPSLFFRGELNASFYAYADLSKTSTYTWTYRNGEFGGSFTTTKENGKPTFEWGANFSVDGFVQAGVLFDFYFGTINMLGLASAGTSLDIYAGPKLSGSLNVDLKKVGTGNLYETLKESKMEFSLLSIDIEAKGKANFLGKSIAEHTFYEDSFKFHKKDFYLFPEFSDPELTCDVKAHSATLKSNVSRSIVPIPSYSLRLGYGLYDKNQKLVQAVYDERPYRFNKNYNEYELPFSSIKPGTYTACPIITIAGYDMPDIPTSQFVDITFAVTPFTDVADLIETDAATLHGHFEGNVEYLADNCQTGFIYAEDGKDMKDGTVVYATTNNEGKLQAVLSDLIGGSTYSFKTFLCVDGEYTYGEPQSFKTPFPVEIANVEVTSATYHPENYVYNGTKYDFKYNCATSVRLTNNTNVEDWGYVYVDPDGSEAKVSLAEFGRSSIKDPRYAYCRNQTESTVTMKAYVKFKNNETIYYNQAEDFPIKYETSPSVKMTNCEFVETKTNVSYNKESYKYLSTFKFTYQATGAYWLTVGTAELNKENSGWSNWSNDLKHETMRPYDGTNILTVNYYYNEKDFDGAYEVRLQGKDSTHNKSYLSDGYATYTYSEDHFTGCIFQLPSNAAPMRLQEPNNTQQDDHEPYEIVANKIIY